MGLQRPKAGNGGQGGKPLMAITGLAIPDAALETEGFRRKQAGDEEARPDALTCGADALPSRRSVPWASRLARARRAR